MPLICSCCHIMHLFVLHGCNKFISSVSAFTNYLAIAANEFIMWYSVEKLIATISCDIQVNSTDEW